MARTTKVAKEVIEKKMENTNSNSTETEFEELKRQVAELTKMLTAKKDLQPELEKKITEPSEGNIKVSGDDYIKVMSLCPHELNLTTQSKGRGKLFTFRKMFEVKRILYRDLADIMENHSAFLEQGLFLILDSDVVRKHGLDETYEKLLDKKKIEQVLQGNQTDAVNMFKIANPKQQKSICELIINDIVTGEPVDLNFVDRISRIVGYNLQESAENIKQLLNK